MKRKACLLILLMLTIFVFTSSALAAKPIIKADKTYFDINSGLYVLKGNVYLQVRDRIITCNEAKVSMGSLEVWGYGSVTVTQGDITFTGDNVYVYGAEDRARVDGGVSFSRTGLSIAADKADFNWASKIGVFSGNVRVTQGDNSWTTDTLSYNVETNTIL